MQLDTLTKPIIEIGVLYEVRDKLFQFKGLKESLKLKGIVKNIV